MAFPAIFANYHKNKSLCVSYIREKQKEKFYGSFIIVIATFVARNC